MTPDKLRPMTYPLSSLLPASRSTRHPHLVDNDSATWGTSGTTLVAGGDTFRSTASGLATAPPDRPPSLNYTARRERARDSRFLLSLMLQCECDHATELSDGLILARHQCRVLRRTILMTVVMGSLATSALGYAALLAPDLFARHPWLMLFMESVGLASLMTVAGLMSYACWIDAMSKTLHEECRRYLLNQWRSQFGTLRHPQTVSADPVRQASEGRPAGAIGGHF